MKTLFNQQITFFYNKNGLTCGPLLTQSGYNIKIRSSNKDEKDTEKRHRNETVIITIKNQHKKRLFQCYFYLLF